MEVTSGRHGFGSEGSTEANVNHPQAVLVGLIWQVKCWLRIPVPVAKKEVGNVDTQSKIGAPESIKTIEESVVKVSRYTYVSIQMTLLSFRHQIVEIYTF